VICPQGSGKFRREERKGSPGVEVRKFRLHALGSVSAGAVQPEKKADEESELSRQVAPCCGNAPNDVIRCSRLGATAQGDCRTGIRHPQTGSGLPALDVRGLETARAVGAACTVLNLEQM